MSALQLDEIVIVGGGCYGTFYTRQLVEARKRGKVEFRRLLVVDRNPECQAAPDLVGDPSRQLVVENWGIFFDGYLGEAAEPRSRGAAEPRSVIVPSPLMPHLMYQWLLRRARERWPSRVVESRPLSEGPGTPYDVSSPDLVRYVSFADWICPTHCTEPSRCPVIRGPRTWEMREAIEDLAARLHMPAPILFECRHQVFAVGSFSVDEVVAGDRVVAEAGSKGEETDLLVGTVSACHGAINLLHLGSA
ncbi:MAG TPA: hypothetical protein VLB12_00900 [Gemmatimonadales bacterium]|nr:hypothetical protein [Gemmatimonadales bacterium]